MGGLCVWMIIFPCVRVASSFNTSFLGLLYRARRSGGLCFMILEGDVG